MSDYKFFHPIEVRYGDLDPQGHVNNAKYLTFFEQARIHYLMHLGLFTSRQSFMEVGVILADIHVTFHSAIQYGDPVRVGVCTSKIGNKSLTMNQCVVHDTSGQTMASGSVVLVTYDYGTSRSIPIPKAWRMKITEFEGL